MQSRLGERGLKSKDVGGAVGLTENPAALRRWMVAGPELSIMIEEFEGSVSSPVFIVHGHHEQNPGITGQSPDFSARRRRPNLHSNHRRSVSNNRQALLS